MKGPLEIRYCKSAIANSTEHPTVQKKFKYKIQFEVDTPALSEWPSHILRSKM